MKLILGLGNPDARYDGTRHNVGWRMLDAFAAGQGGEFVAKPKLHASLAEVTLDGEKLLLAKPDTYYNDSGLSYRALLDFYKLSPEDTLVIHDELALGFGTVRVRHGGSHAGNNGIKSIISHGGQNSSRIRIGIANHLRQRVADTDFVLGKFSKAESDHLDLIAKEVIRDIEKFAHGDLSDTSYTLPLDAEQ